MEGKAAQATSSWLVISKERSSHPPGIHLSKPQGDCVSWTIHRGKTLDLAPPPFKTLAWIPNIHQQHGMKNCAVSHTVAMPSPLHQLLFPAVSSPQTCLSGKLLHSQFQTHLSPTCPQEALLGSPRCFLKCLLSTCSHPYIFPRTPTPSWKCSDLLVYLP